MLLLVLMCKVNVENQKKKPFVAFCKVLTSQGKFARLIYICQQGGDFEERHSKAASLRKRWNVHGYAWCVWDMFSRRIQGKMCFWGLFALCVRGKTAGNVCFSLLVVSIWDNVP